MVGSIAIIGESCFLPGANRVEEFWKSLESGGDGITSIPLERLQEDQAADPRYTSMKAGFLKCGIDEFDEKSFGITPRKAGFMENSHLNTCVNFSLLQTAESCEKIVNEKMRDLMETYDVIEKGVRAGGKVSFVIILKVFYQVGWRPVLGNSVSLEKFMTDFSILPKYKRVVKRLFDILEEDEILTHDHSCEEARWIISKQPPPFDELVKESDKLNISARTVSDLNDYEVHLLKHCGENLKDILLGNISSHEVYFGGDNPEWNPYLLYTESKAGFVAHERAKYFLQCKFDSIAATGSILRILEVGACNGSMTEVILKGLQQQGIPFRYTFTDISPSFLDEAKQHFKNIAGVEYKILDIENDPKRQNFVPHSYDVVVAAHVLHVTKDLFVCAKNIRQLLVPSGTLVLEEMMKPDRIVDMLFGTLEGYWEFQDFRVKNNHPCINENEWENVLLSNGFKNSCLISEQKEFSSIIIAEFKQSTWIIFSGNDCRISESLNQIIHQAGDTAVIVSDRSSRNGENLSIVNEFLDYSDEENISVFLTSMIESHNVKGIIVLLSLDNILDCEQSFCKTCLYITQGLVNGSYTCQVVVATRGVYCIGDQGNINPSQATIWGCVGREIFQ